MVLEASVICVDTSDWMRNGDYPPTRLEAQQDAVNLLVNYKTQSNPENTVGIVSVGGKSADVLVSLTNDLGKVFTCLRGARVGGKINFMSGLQVALLALKHRQNKNQHQRIIVFVGSPVEEDSNTLVRFAKRLKKNNVAVDVINFGEEVTNMEKLEAFINAVNSNDNSHLVTIPPGPHILSDILVSSPVVTGGGEDGGAGGASSAASFAEYGGVDPNLDPDLAMALKMSMEEERARQESESKQKGEEGGTPSEKAAPSETKTKEVEMGEADEETLLQEAIALSMKQEGTSSSTPSEPQQSGEDMDEDLQAALQMSMQQGAKTEEEDYSSLLSSLPGVDPNDPRVKNVLKGFEKKDEEKKDDDKK